LAAILLIPLVGATSADGVPRLGKKAPPAHGFKGYRVGIAERSINPDPDGTFAGQPVYLGGYGIGGGSPVFEGRPATGILGVGPSVRAFAVADRTGSAFAIADVETQGWFVATKDGPYGLLDMRKAVEERTGGRLDAERVVVQTDHSHAGADTIGVWGGVPVEYRRFIVEQTVDAIVEAYETMRPGRLFYGTAPGADLLSNQFDYDEANGNDVLDSDVRVLQARDDEGEPVATLLNFSAHATVLGSGNTKISGDWVQAANPLLEQRFGGEAMTVVGTLGRTQPGDRGCSDPGATGEDAQNLCRLHDYAARVVDRAADAVAAAEPIAGDIVDARSYLIEDVSSNALILGLAYGGEPIGVPINRALTPPWLTGNVLGTVTASARIGDVLLSSGPGEMYPQIPLKAAEIVPARGYMTAGLANDQLGYLIAPFEAYPEPIRRSFFNQEGDEVSPIDNDNYFFNVSHTMGERVTCSLLRGAGEVLGRGLEYRSRYDRCAAFANDLLFEHGADTGF
ncbi:MAG: neutral/alkaline non-lysosomal ceramidase N-terminal domain-containing protein, partial [Acidimicrobiia bacterium]